ncbi:MAG TPA: DUF962 domain-containing protein [Magnetospirillaceae bacterium]|jgi:hypothetical protein
MAERSPTFREFFPEYLAAHRKPQTRAIHYIGTTLGVISLIIFFVTWNWEFLVASPLLGYGMAMPTHPIFEGNIPKTFEHPALSFVSDFFMLYLFLTGGLARYLNELPPVEASQTKAA